MAYEIATENRGKYLLFRVRGEQTLEGNAELVKVILGNVSETGIDRVIVDLRGLSGQPGTIQDFELAKMIKAEHIRDFRKAALIYEPEREKHTAFFVSACRALGLEIKAFMDEKEAEGWLG